MCTYVFIYVYMGANNICIHVCEQERERGREAHTCISLYSAAAVHRIPDRPSPYFSPPLNPHRVSPTTAVPPAKINKDTINKNYIFFIHRSRQAVGGLERGNTACAPLRFFFLRFCVPSPFSYPPRFPRVFPFLFFFFNFFCNTGASVASFLAI